MDNKLVGPVRPAHLKAGAVHTANQTAKLFIEQTLKLGKVPESRQCGGQHLNTGGKCVIPCCCRQLSATLRHEQCCLRALMDAPQADVQEQPPVFSKLWCKRAWMTGARACASA